MIKVTIELQSARGREHDRLLGVALISNEGEIVGRPGLCKYAVWLSKWAPRERQAWRQGETAMPAGLLDGMEGAVESFDREKRGAWDLLYLALRAVVGDRNP